MWLGPLTNSCSDVDECDRTRKK